MAEDKPLRVGVLGAARIAPRAIVAPARATGVAEVVAVASRDRGRAEAFAEANGVAAVFDDYEALIADPGVEAIYNALPPARHAALSIAALKAGKPVLCEKPFCMNAGEARDMVAAGRAAGVLLMEGFHYRYHPFFERVLEIVRSGELGTLRRLESVFTATIAKTPGEIRYDPAIGGGAIMDLGTYCLHWCRSVAGEEPAVTWARADRDTGGADVSTRAGLIFPSGLEAEVYCDMAAPMAARLTIEGADGTLTVNNPLAPQMGGATLTVTGGDPREERGGREPTFDFQLQAFVAAVRGGPAPVTSGADSIAQMQLLDAVRAASR